MANKSQLSPAFPHRPTKPTKIKFFADSGAVMWTVAVPVVGETEFEHDVAIE